MTTATPAPDGADAGATGPFAEWYTAAGVRSGVRRLFHDESDQGKVFFPERLVPFLDHPLLAGLDRQQRSALALRHLYQFLISTTHMETRVVNTAAERIANGRSGVELTPDDRLDAFKVYCDEGYHALYSLDLAHQIADTTGVPVPDWDYGRFVDRLVATANRLLPGEPVLAGLLQVVVFETLITAVLNELPGDTTVITTVRDLMRDHARDEGRHHRFFSGYFHRLWHALDARHRALAAHALPALIHDCLAADLGPARASLALAGVDADVIAGVVDDHMATDRERIRSITRSTVRMCRSAGVFDVPGAYEEFARHGLVAGDGGE
ncbi:hypothetical protein E1265_01600 [Streptomyces sp. 8K308]|uniref:diiron oxygenase n=1 Tax=Streptomyces sp. 8K308 TaxID=2530388 RepID=UPI00104C2E0B|nr:diiron oxygenase [Streptomyces sp. 8K308]TDC27413.1 hypothetical protein E1265_01600 [Streptomyces sp. 8K308]